MAGVLPGDEVKRRVEAARLLTGIARITRHRYAARAEWSRIDPHGCKQCGYDEQTDTFYDSPTTEECSVELRVRYRSKRSRRLRVAVVGSSCF